MRRGVAANYAAIVVAIVAALPGSLWPNAPGRFGLALLSVSLVTFVAVRVLMHEMSAAAAADERAVRHLRAQKQTLLLFVAAGVVASFDWLLYFRHITIGFSLNVAMQLVINGFCLAALGVLGLGVIRLVREALAG